MRPSRPWLLPAQPVTRAMLLASGITRSMVDTQVRAGRLLAVRHGVYVSADAWADDPRTRHVALGHAEQAANPGAVLSHQSAAVVWGLPSPTFQDWHELEVCVTLPPCQHGSHRGPARHRLRVLQPDDVVRDAEGYDVTSIPRTATDLAAGRALPEALVVLDGAARLILAGLPAPELQGRLVTARGTFYPDFHWAEHRVIGEVDGAVKYEAAEAFVAEKQREQVLRDLGYTVVRWLAREIMLTPEVVVARVSRALGR